MPASDGTGRKTGDGIDDLTSVVEQLAAEVKSLSSRVEEVMSAVKALGDPPEAAPSPPRKPTRNSGQAASSRQEVKRVAVVVAPLPELAMAAMAETSLRDLPGVREVVASERVEDAARFTLEAVESTDVIAEMRHAMPVAFTVLDPGPEEISVRLHWAWGTQD